MSGGVLLVGGGLAAQRCAETLRRLGYEGRVQMICGEPHRPYDRPPLSKEVISDREISSEDVYYRPWDWYEAQAIELTLNTRACSLDVVARVVDLTNGTRLAYDQLLIASGSRPRTLPSLERFANVSVLRTIEDSHKLRDTIREGTNLAIIGGGLIGQEVAVSAANTGAHVTIIEAESEPLSRVLGPELGNWFAALHRSEGVDVRISTQVTAVQGNGLACALSLTDGSSLDCDHVLVGVGVRPDLDWLKASGLDMRGVRTDSDSRTDTQGVFAAGDAASTFDPILERHVVGGHWEAAARQGARAAKAMLDLDPEPPRMTSFWTDLYNTRIQYLGHASLADETRIDGDPDSRDFTAMFLREGQPVGGLLVGRPRQLPAIRALLAGTIERTAT
jgi:NADPH-dependent 2,4-dienoyl-CoA reductase/sulfur reductase-like enzyme